MEDKLLALVDRLGKDIDGMPWLDKSLPPAQLKHSVEFFIRAWQNDAKDVIQQGCEKCNQVTYALDLANTPQAGSDASDDDYKTEHVIKAIKKVRNIIKGEKDGEKEND